MCEREGERESVCVYEEGREIERVSECERKRKERKKTFV